MFPYRKGMTAATDMSDAKTFVAWLDAQPQVNKNRKVGVQGYCMGGPMSFHTAAAVPDRVGAVASFHGGGLVGKDPATSPHVLAAATKASRVHRSNSPGIRRTRASERAQTPSSSPNPST